ncbi:MAG: PAS domain-containing protein [Candidatus Binatia bacterium]
MKTKDLEVFNEMPFLFWVKDEQGTYIWGNRTISRLAGEEIAGKIHRDLVWADNADALQAADRQVFESGEPSYLHEYVDKSSHGQATLNVCKWLGEFEGRKCCLGISFIIE